MSKDTPEKIRPYIFHGVELPHQSRKVWEGDCPLCGKEKHFYVSSETGQFQCKSCLEEGNIHSFLTHLHTLGKELPLLDLSVRGIEEETALDWGVVTHPLIGDHLLFPAYNQKGKLANLFKVSTFGKAAWRPYGTPTCLIHPFGTDLINKKHQVLWITEGPWDGMALYQSLKKISSSSNLTKSAVESANGRSPIKIVSDPSKSLVMSQGILAVPGCGSFNEKWLDYLKGRDVRVVFDNDHPKKTRNGKSVRPGFDGQRRIQKIAGDRPKTLSILYWGIKGHDPDLESGYDVRDLFLQKKTRGGMTRLITGLQKVATEETSESAGVTEVEAIERTSFDDLCQDFHSKLHFTRPMRDTFAVMLATIISTDLQGDQLWIRVVGPPGSGKSTLAEACAAAGDYVMSRSKVTGFHSGMGKVGENDYSLIGKMNGKTFLLKDADTLMSSSGIDSILSELRDIYDGESRAEYRNQKEAKIYENLRITFILCGTDELRGTNKSFLGDRFLDTEILEEGDDEPFLDIALDKSYDILVSSLQGEDKQKDEFLKRVTKGFIIYLKENIKNLPIPDFPDKQKEKVKALGKSLALMRARISKDQEGNSKYRPRTELATRICSQLIRLSVCLCLVMGKKKVDDEVIRIVVKITRDTGKGFQEEILTLLSQHPRGLSVKQLAHSLSLAETTTKRTLTDLHEFQAVKTAKRPNNSGARGRHLKLWKLTDDVTEIWKVITQLLKKE